MRLYLVRHGQAKTKQQDPERPLSDDGVAEVHRMGACLQALRAPVATVWHSGKTRARQTADILAAAIDPAPSVREMKHLKPNDPVRPVINKIHGYADRGLLIVGHLPHLNKLTARLLGHTASDDLLSVSTGTIICLDNPTNHWQIKWMLSPDLVAALSAHARTAAPLTASPRAAGANTARTPRRS